MHPDMQLDLARARIDELIRQAERHRRGKAAAQRRRSRAKLRRPPATVTSAAREPSPGPTAGGPSTPAGVQQRDLSGTSSRI